MITGAEAITAAFADFGETALIDNGTSIIGGLFSAVERAMDDGDIEIQLDNPTFTVSAADAESMTNNSTVLTIDGIHYQIHDRSKAAMGLVTLYLTRDY